MNLLLDTHALLWQLEDSPKLSYAASRAINDPLNLVHISAVSAYEISFKLSLGKLPIVGGLRAIREYLDLRNITFLDLTFAHCEAAGALDQSHRDPFDRMLAAQSKLEDLVLVTIDSAFEIFGTKTLW